jgi:hypothetical protein
VHPRTYVLRARVTCGALDKSTARLIVHVGRHRLLFYYRDHENRTRAYASNVALQRWK